MEIATPPWKRLLTSFRATPLKTLRSCQAPPSSFWKLKIWLEVQTPLPPKAESRGRGGGGGGDGANFVGTMLLANLFFPGCDIINFEINLISLSKPFFYMTKKAKQQKFNYLEDEKIFQGELKSIFCHFKVLLVAKNWLRPESALLSAIRDNLLSFSFQISPKG